VRLAAVVLAAMLVSATSPPAAQAAARVTGVVRTLLRPLAGVHVELPEVGARAVSDTSGRFVLAPVPAGVHRLELVAVGYEPLHGSVAVGLRADSTGAMVDAGPFLLSPLRPDETPIGFSVPSGTPAPPARAPVPVVADSLPAPLAPPIGFFRTPEEAERWPVEADLRPASQGPNGTAAAFADLLRRVAVADSITRATGGTGAPGFETWKQWADRFALFAGDSARALEPALETDSALVRRAVAYARTRAALAAGPTRAGYALASAARSEIARARGTRGDDTAFLSFLGEEIDRVFVPGSAPPPAPKAAPAKKKRRSIRRG